MAVCTTLLYMAPVDTHGAAHKEIDVLPWLSRCALDCICQGILGYPSSSLSAAEDDTYSEALRMMGCVRSFRLSFFLS
jgi:hypothetical protein